MKNGFTLIELLVVIAIISILTIMTVGQFQTAKRKANDVARKGDLNAVSKALQMYYTDYGFFPDPTTITWGGTFQDSSNPPYVYMKKLPIENFLPSKPYCYKISADKKKYALFAQLENTLDKECSGNYSCGTPISANYCYAIVSPNTSLAPNGDLQ